MNTRILKMLLAMAAVYLITSTNGANAQRESANSSERVSPKTASERSSIINKPVRQEKQPSFTVIGGFKDLNKTFDIPLGSLARIDPEFRSHCGLFGPTLSDPGVLTLETGRTFKATKSGITRVTYLTDCYIYKETYSVGIRVYNARPSAE